MKKSKLDLPQIKKKVVTGLAVGDSSRTIAKEVGLSHSQVARYAKRDEIRSLVQEEQLNLADCVPDAVENMKALVREMSEIPKEDTKRLDLAYKASKDVLKSFGLMPSPTQSQTMVNIFQDQSKQVMSPFVTKILEEHVNKLYPTEEELEEMRECEET